MEVHGQNRVGNRTPEYRAWDKMIQRCKNPKDPKYPSYGGRGIEVYTPWKNDFRVFFADVGPRPGTEYSLDRIDNNKGYEPKNVRWATRSQQQRNRRVNRLLTVDGTTHCIVEWAEILGCSPERLRKRLRLGWTPEQIIYGKSQGI